MSTLLEAIGQAFGEVVPHIDDTTDTGVDIETYFVDGNDDVELIRFSAGGAFDPVSEMAEIHDTLYRYGNDILDDDGYPSWVTAAELFVKQLDYADDDFIAVGEVRPVTMMTTAAFGKSVCIIDRFKGKETVVWIILYTDEVEDKVNTIIAGYKNGGQFQRDH